MRKDIELHIQTGDVALDAQNKFKLREFRWVDDEETAAMLSRYIYAEVDVPYSISIRTIQNNGVYFEIPYTPKYKEFKMRIRRVYDDGTYEYLQNDVDGSHWFLVQASLYGTGLKNVFASMLPAISETSFYVYLRNGIAELYSSSQSDFNIVNANRQNANCLLACFPGGNYRYPLTGVGLARWINATNVVSTDLTTVLQDEFGADGVTVKNAAYNYDTHQMELEMTAQDDD
jgi:hypothetical protein